MTTEALARIEIHVHSLAKPSAEGLLHARQAIGKNQELREVFLKAREDASTAPALAECLQPLLTKVLGTDATEEARYLADEYVQAGNAVLIISRETGRAVAKVTDEDLWVPKVPPRHVMVKGQSGDAKTMAPRLRPEIEGFLVQRMFDEEREQNLFFDMMTKVEATALIGPESDRRLLPVTRKGRKTALEEIRAALPDLLPTGALGASRQFLDCFDFVTSECSPTGLLRLSGVAETHVSVPIQDPKAFNLRHDVPTRLLAVIAARWSRLIASALVGAVQPTAAEGAHGCAVWLAPSTHAEGLKSRAPVLVIDGGQALGLRAKAGSVLLERAAVKCMAREVHDRWDVGASIPYTLWVNPKHVFQAPAVEIQTNFIAEVV
jgi:hypothetical protein